MATNDPGTEPTTEADHLSALGEEMAVQMDLVMDPEVTGQAPEDGESLLDDPIVDPEPELDTDDLDPDEPAEPEPTEKPSRSQKRIRQLDKKAKELQARLEQEQQERENQLTWLVGSEGQAWLQSPAGITWQMQRGVMPSAQSASQNQTAPQQDVDFAQMTDAQITAAIAQNTQNAMMPVLQQQQQQTQQSIQALKHELTVSNELKELAREYPDFDMELDADDVTAHLEFQMQRSGSMDRHKAFRAIDPDRAMNRTVHSQRKKSAQSAAAPSVKGAVKTERTQPGRQAKLRELADAGNKDAHYQMLGDLALASTPEKRRRV